MKMFGCALAAGMMFGAAAMDFQPITVEKAEYGNANAKVDLSPKMAGVVRDGRVLIFQASNQFAGKDPAVREGKSAVVFFKNAKGEKKQAEAREGQFVAVFDLDEPIPTKPTVLGAWFGAADEFGKTVDLTSSVRLAAAEKKDLKIDLGLTGGKDPGVGKTKVLIVLYSLDGKPMVKTVPENQMFKPAEFGF